MFTIRKERECKVVAHKELPAFLQIRWPYNEVRSNMFFNYEGRWYSLDDFLCVEKDNPLFSDFHGYYGGRYTTGIAVRLDVWGDGDTLTAAQYIQ